MRETFSDIPRLYTALAEWSACIIYIVILKRRFSLGKTVSISIAALIIQSVILVLTGDSPILLWVPFMLLAVGCMYLFLHICCDISVANVSYCCIRAFLLAEFAASLEWQLYYYLAINRGYNNICIQAIFLGVVYGAVFTTGGFLEKNALEGYNYQITKKELWSALSIVVLSFSFSNLSYLYSNTPFSGKFATDIFNARTLIDLVGVSALYAYQSRIIELNMKTELYSINSVLKSQYNHYLQYKESIDLINCKYHDIKHQITALRNEKDLEKRGEWLDAMENELQMYEAINYTGNSVLDTILTGKTMYCQKHNISLTCIADGTLLNSIHVTDICTIFGNALDNAIESVIMLQDVEKRLIHLSVTGKKNFIFISVENYCDKDLKIEGNLPLTTKHDKVNHGYGMKSMRYSVKKYNGTMSFEVKQNWFVLKILIPKVNNK